jgi:hypothetical protein
MLCAFLKTIFQVTQRRESKCIMGNEQNGNEQTRKKIRERLLSGGLTSADQENKGSILFKKPIGVGWLISQKQTRGHKQSKGTITGLMWGKEMYERNAWPTASHTKSVLGSARLSWFLPGWAETWLASPTSSTGRAKTPPLSLPSGWDARGKASEGGVSRIESHNCPNGGKLWGSLRVGAWPHVWGHHLLLLDLSSNCEEAW